MESTILALAYLVAFALLLVSLGAIAEVGMSLMDARRRRGGAISKMAEPAGGARPPGPKPWSMAWLKSEEVRMALSPAGPLAKDITKCQRCSEPIVFLQSFNKKTGKRGRMPVNLRPTTDKLRPPNAGEIDFKFGEHQSHFATCEAAEYFRGRSGRQD